MGSFLFTEFQAVFGGGAVNDTANFMASVIGALRTVFAENGAVAKGMALFMGIAGMIAIIAYFMELWDLSAKDLLSFDKLVLSFLKFVFVFSVLIFSQDLIVGGFNLCAAGYDVVVEQMPGINTSSDNMTVTYFGQSSIPESYTQALEEPLDDVTQSVIEDDIEDGATISMETIFSSKNFIGGGVLERTLKMLSSIMTLFIPYLICFIAKIAAYIICISNAIQLIAYGILSPIALSQCFDGGTRGTGIVYLKKFLATGLTFGIIIIVLYAAQWLQAGVATWTASTASEFVTDGALAINATNFYDIIGRPGMLLPYTVIQFGAVGAIFKCDQIARDMLGAR